MPCELCESPGGRVLWNGGRCRVVLVSDPDYPGFCRVIWNDHVKEMTDLMPEERQHLMKIVLSVEACVREVLKPDKVNLASLGNLAPHLHWHVIPRFHDDPHFPNSIWGARQRETKPRKTRVEIEQLCARVASVLSGPADFR